jgi:Cu(I)/Ag(I) efflux system membrane protein CusA/SilA
MFVIPAAWLLLKRRQVRREIDGTSGTHVPSAYSGEMK